MARPYDMGHASCGIGFNVDSATISHIGWNVKHFPASARAIGLSPQELHRNAAESTPTRLRERRCRLTPQRLAVLKILKVDFPTTSLATVYKTVTLLKEMGEVLELGFSDGSNRYDGSRPYPHPHLLCTQCDAIEDLEVDAVREIPRQVAQDTGYRIVSHRLDFFGICPRCQAAS